MRITRDKSAQEDKMENYNAKSTLISWKLSEQFISDFGYIYVLYILREKKLQYGLRLSKKL